VGVTATVVLPGGPGKAITENGKALAKASGVTEVKVTGEQVVLKAGSGDYRFESR
jgi:alpha-L-rhamnosidase